MVKYFSHLLKGRDFTVFTDHKPLTFALFIKADRYSSIETSHADFISKFSSDIHHIASTDNIPADT